jgi:sporulation-control protein spo0M
MGFSEKMRDSLGAEGARIEVAAPEHAVSPGDTATIHVAIVGGTKPAVVDALVLRLVEADRHWRDEQGATLSEAEVGTRDDRSQLTAGWTRNTLFERRIEVGVTVDPGARHELTVELAVPIACRPSDPACNHALHVQADIKGQIDPTGQARLKVG